MNTEKLSYVGIDIGSTASKAAVIHNEQLIDTFVLPTGWNGRGMKREERLVAEAQKG